MRQNEIECAAPANREKKNPRELKILNRLLLNETIYFVSSQACPLLFRFRTLYHVAAVAIIYSESHTSFMTLSISLLCCVAVAGIVTFSHSYRSLVNSIHVWKLKTKIPFLIIESIHAERFFSLIHYDGNFSASQTKSIHLILLAMSLFRLPLLSKNQKPIRFVSLRIGQANKLLIIMFMTVVLPFSLFRLSSNSSFETLNR